MCKKLTIIIPIFNVEEYIRTCLLSVLNQGLEEEDYEVILINDGTPDNSLGVIGDLIESHNNIKVVEQSNKGLSVARNVGIANANGEYILFIDSDDLLIDNSLSKLLDIAIESKADLIVADYIVHSEESDLFIPISHSKEIKQHIKFCTEPFLVDLKKREYNVWRTIYRRQFLISNKISFVEGITFEDSPFTFECYIKAKKCVRISYPFYIYRRRHGTLSSAINKKSVLDMNKVIEKSWELSNLKDISQQIRELLFDHIYAIFSLNLWYISQHHDILKDREEIVNDLKSRVPNINFSNGFKQRMVSFFFKTMPCTYLKIRSYF